jgi:hypothetical protein
LNVKYSAAQHEWDYVCKRGLNKITTINHNSSQQILRSTNLKGTSNFDQSITVLMKIEILSTPQTAGLPSFENCSLAQFPSIRCPAPFASSATPITVDIFSCDNSTYVRPKFFLIIFVRFRCKL